MLILVAGLNGIGHHVWDTTEAELPKVPRLLQVGDPTFIADTCLTAAFWFHPVRLGSPITLHSRDMASEVITAIPADTHLHTLEVWSRLLGLSHLDLGQLDLLRQHSIRHHLSMPSNRRGLELVLSWWMQKYKHVFDRFWCGQRVFRSFEYTTPYLGNMALADGAEKESWHYYCLCYGSTVRALISSIPSISAVTIHSECRDCSDSPVSAFVSSIFRLLYATRIGNSPDASFKVVQIALWAYVLVIDGFYLSSRQAAHPWLG